MGSVSGGRGGVKVTGLRLGFAQLVSKGVLEPQLNFELPRKLQSYCI